MLEPILQATRTFLAWPDVLIPIMGTLLGLIVGILPGIGGATAVALLLPLTFSMSPEHAMMLLLPIQGAASQGGALTAILLNVPGETVNAATAIDGHALARQGKAGVAIGASATASAMGAMFGLVVLAALLPVMRRVVLAFGPAEFFALAIVALLMMASVSRGAMLKGLIAGGLGMIFGLHGFNQVVGGARYTFGITQLWDGFRLIPVLLGLFAVAETLDVIAKRASIAKATLHVMGGTWEGIRSVFVHKWLFLRSSVLGTIIGIIPGVGGAVATFMAYAQAVQTSKRPEEFGKGRIEGVIAPEAASDAKDGGALVPTISLGIPGSVFQAVLLTAFLIHGIIPGRSLMEDRLSIVWIIILALAFSNVLSSIVVIVFANPLAKITLVPPAIIVPVMLGFSVVGAFADQGAFFGVGVAILFGLLGYGMKRLGYPLAPMIIGFVLTPIAETGFHQAIQISRGSYAIFYTRPLTAMIFFIGLASLVLPFLRAHLRRPASLYPAAVEKGGG